MTRWTTDHAAYELLNRERSRRAGRRISSDWPAFDLPTAYKVQDSLVRRKVDTGDELAGIKLGLTSEAKQKRMGISAPLTAWLTKSMALPEDASVRVDQLIHPRVEPEIVFTIGRRLAGPGVTASSAMRAVAEVRAGFEIIDSRFNGFQFTLPDVVADNASASHFLLSSYTARPDALDLQAERCELRAGGEFIDSATGAAVQGDPAAALALAANSLAERGHAIEPGWLVLTGGLTDAVPLMTGLEISAEFTHLGTLSVTGC